ncbi:DNA ligase D [Texcoconibacillus texcoconensis]|uniref:DNA ligase (ATP) n=1 Tax=Texcoconibacillus texcoconensis TaxID=1095777 RepID=A0A840QM93_9BACI|nr:DNA ligase D [Texcoconibacillus texcoconensis]MBB5172494.1 bifunctional non-homologous end joining protein LigD [Texcoconibacillus texcoconensis]
MQWMKPTRTDELPKGDQWHYEIKYDGYRAKLTWDGKSLSITSKNGHTLEDKFPEINTQDLPTDKTFELDGELSILDNLGKADFYTLQRRHRLRNQRTIQTESKTRPATFLAFDILSINGENLLKKPWQDRKHFLKEMMLSSELPINPDPHATSRVQFLPSTQDLSAILEKVMVCRSEGIIAKRATAQYEKGRTRNWLKYKTPYLVNCFITAYEPSNEYFRLGVFNHTEGVASIGKCAHGFSEAEKEAVTSIIKQNGDWNETNNVYEIEPSIVTEVAYTTRKNDELREPRFAQLKLQTPASSCTVAQLQMADLRFPSTVKITNPEKPLWTNNQVDKRTYLRYVRFIAPFALPFLKDRPLTVIRFPHGTMEEGFFQKECPDYAPEFVETTAIEDTEFILCNRIETMLWLANQLALEWHIPFQRHQTEYVDDIVFDLDPPSAEYFHLAIKGALLLKELCDSLGFHSFVKFSGNKGLQVYIPLPEDTYTWEDTAKVTETFGTFLTDNHPDLFTMERLKKKRGHKLYLDIPQHREGKTIIAPYSLRGKTDPLVACPLFWEEVNDSLERTQFTIDHVLERVTSTGCPFRHIEEVKRLQPKNFESFKS